MRKTVIDHTERAVYTVYSGRVSTEDLLEYYADLQGLVAGSEGPWTEILDLRACHRLPGRTGSVFEGLVSLRRAIGKKNRVVYMAVEENQRLLLDDHIHSLRACGVDAQLVEAARDAPNPWAAKIREAALQSRKLDQTLPDLSVEDLREGAGLARRN